MEATIIIVSAMIIGLIFFVTHLYYKVIDLEDENAKLYIIVNASLHNIKKALEESIEFDNKIKKTLEEWCNENKQK